MFGHESIVDYERDERRTVRNTVPPWEQGAADAHDRQVPRKGDDDEPQPRPGRRTS